MGVDSDLNVLSKHKNNLEYYLCKSFPNIDLGFKVINNTLVVVFVVKCIESPEMLNSSTKINMVELSNDYCEEVVHIYHDEYKNQLNVLETISSKTMISMQT